MNIYFLCNRKKVLIVITKTAEQNPKILEVEFRLVCQEFASIIKDLLGVIGSV